MTNSSKPTSSKPTSSKPTSSKPTGWRDPKGANMVRRHPDDSDDSIHSSVFMHLTDWVIDHVREEEQVAVLASMMRAVLEHGEEISEFGWSRVAEIAGVW